MKENTLRITILLVAFLMSVIGLSAQTLSSYSCDFEDRDERSAWQRNFGPDGPYCPSKWEIDTAINNGGKYSMYISPDGGATAGYTNGMEYVVAYRTITLAAGTYNLSFDWQAMGGDTVDGLYVCWMPEDVRSNSNYQSCGFPTFARGYALRYPSSDTTRLYGQTWNAANTTITSDGTAHKLVFVWTNYVFEPVQTGACIDNIEIQPVACALPDDIQMNADATGVTMSWAGTAESYDVRCKTSNDTEWQTFSGVTGNEIRIEGMNEGELGFYVRANCGDGSSTWRSFKKFMFYPGNRCIDYLGLSMDNCYAGTFGNPLSGKTAVDYGYASIKSRHTVHYDKGEVDPRTGGRLNTVPLEDIASVRLGNWDINAQAEAIEYDMHVDTSQYSILLINYAIVMQNPNHDEKAQPRFTLQTLRRTATGSYVAFDEDMCGDADFSAGYTDGDGWGKAPGADGITVEYKTWSTVGLNLAEHHGEDIRIRFTTYDCAEKGHYGYAYFTIRCEFGEIEHLSCGNSEDNRLQAPLGFLYRWYKASDPDNTLSTERVFEAVDGPTDTAIYKCDIIQPTNQKCYYTLTVNATVRWPVADADYTTRVANCQTVATFTDKSYVLKGGEPESGAMVDSLEWFVIDTQGNDTIYTTKEWNPEIVFPDLGGDFNVVQRAYLADACTDEKIFPFDVEAGDTERDTIVEHICAGDGIMFDNKYIRESGFYNDTIGNTASGCPRIETLALYVQELDSANVRDTVCTNKLPYDFYGEQLYESGVYRHLEQNAYGCDSMLHVLDLIVNESLNMTVPSEVNTCADDAAIEIPFEVTSGLITSYDLRFDDAELDGLLGVTGATPQDSSVSIALPDEGVAPGVYAAEAVFRSMDCDDVTIPLNINILYPDSIILQRWNDVLGIRNSDWNGGYDFVAYEWFENGVRIEGQNSSNLYMPDGLDFTGSYHARITRADGVAVNTCPVTPTEYPSSEITVVPTVTFTGGTFSVKSSVDGVARMWTMTGMLVSQTDIVNGQTDITAPSADGVYIMEFRMADGTEKVQKVIVNGDVK